MDRIAAAERYMAAAQEAISHFPIVPAELAPVWVSENVTFRVTDGRDGAAYVLRLHRPGYHDLAELDSERLWTAALAAAGIAVPVGLEARDGRSFVPVAIPETGEIRHAGVTRWTEGEVLEDVLEREGPAAGPRHFRRLGAAAAALHKQASEWTPPAGFTRHRLDAEGLMGEAPWWGRFWESQALPSAERALLLATRGRIAAALDSLGQDPAIFGLIHADLHPGNVLVAGDRLTVIDFDDAGFGWHAYDIAVALFQDQGRPGFAEVRAALLAGYRSVRALDMRTEALIPMFLLIRGLAVIGWLSQRPEIDPSTFLGATKPAILAQCQAFEAPC